jgi:Lrp/AsnC family leucine-responsive transcriptional regulator
MKELDRQICSLLQQNARMSLSDIAEQVGTSIPTISEHIRKLEESGVIRGFTAVLDPVSCGMDVAAFIFVDMESSAAYDSFRKNCRHHPEILDCHAITGDASHLLKVRAKNTAALEHLLSQIQRWKGVTRTLTSVVLSTHKETLQIHLPSED